MRGRVFIARSARSVNRCGVWPVRLRPLFGSCMRSGTREDGGMKGGIRSSFVVLAVGSLLFGCDEEVSAGSAVPDRSEREVCGRWRAVNAAGDGGATGFAIPESCIAPETAATEVAAALERLNAARWLAGVAEVSGLEAHQTLAEQAALMMARNRSVDPVPDRAWACYTEEVGTAYRWTSHALGVTSVAQAVELFVASAGDPSLANRMWMLDPVLDGVGLARVADAAAVYVRGYVPRPSPQFVAYPGPGPFPAAWLPSVWSFAAPGSLQGAEAMVTDKSTGAEVPFTVSLAQVGSEGGLSVLALTPEGALSPGSYAVSLTTVGGRWAYEVQVVKCMSEASP